jgi:hypothetical protein
MIQVNRGIGLNLEEEHSYRMRILEPPQKCEVWHDRPRLKQPSKTLTSRVEDGVDRMDCFGWSGEARRVSIKWRP